MSHSKGGDKGFTLIELLIVIAIIGVLAATVVVSLGSQTDKATSGSIKLGLSSLRTLAHVEVTTEGSSLSGGDLCDGIYEQVSGEKGTWEWNGSRQCAEGALITGAGFTLKTTTNRQSTENAKGGEMCCHAKATKWVVWAALPGADGSDSGKGDNDIYCADSKGFLGELDLSTATNLQTDTGNAKCK